jgi:hypothetical protein
MSIDTVELVRKGKLTSFYFKLLENVNIKLDKKIDVISDKIVAEFENKKLELTRLKTQLDDYNKIKTSIDNLNKYYSFNKSDNKQIKNISSVQNPNPLVTTKNLLDTLDDITINIEGGDFIKLQLSNNTTTTSNKSLLLKDSDNTLGKYERLLVKKKNIINNINTQNVCFETGGTNIIIKFNNYRVQADEINIRYLTLQNESKAKFSYINNILGSNDGIKWEAITQVNLAYLRNFEKASVFKYPSLIKGSSRNTNYYQYFCFCSLPTKEIIPKTQINKLLNRINIPIYNFEIFGNYYSIKNDNIVSDLEGEFQKFFDTYINSNYEEVSNKVEIDYILNMLLESFKELNNVITNCKVENAMNTVLTEVKEKLEQSKNDEPIISAVELPKEEKEVKVDKQEEQEVEEIFVEESPVKNEELINEEEIQEVEPVEQFETQNINDIYLDNLMNDPSVNVDSEKENISQNNTKKKKIKIFDTESNTIDIENNTGPKSKYSRKKKANK